MIDAIDFDALIEETRKEDEKRETLIKRSRDIQRWSKQSIFSLHRQDYSEATERLDRALQVINEVKVIVEEHPLLRIGAFSSAMEEYSEARILEFYLREGHLLPLRNLPLARIDEYLGGVLDFSGELLRHAIQRATARDMAAVIKARDLVQEMMDYFLKLDLRNNAIRKKFDSLKYTLKKLETTMYELSLAKDGSSFVQTQKDMEDRESTDQES